MYSDSRTPGNNEEQRFVSIENPHFSLDQAMDFHGPIGFPMHNVGMQEGAQFYNLTTGDLQINENASVDKNLKAGKGKGIGEGSSMHSHALPDKNQEETYSIARREARVEHANENARDGDAHQDEYIHVRAKRGQATNSHSLAERFRREKINERMRLLQDLVPGCNKITGKAMMLDEIINYVQSLQRQVEFLSMKLAAISPGLNSDLGHIALKDILRSQDAHSDYLGSGPRLNNVHANLYSSSPHGFSLSHPEVFSSISNPGGVQTTSVAQFRAMPQIPGVWDCELPNVVPVGFSSDVATTTSQEQSDSMKVE